MSASEWEWTKGLYKSMLAEESKFPEVWQDMINLLTIIEQHEDLVETHSRTGTNQHLRMLIPGTNNEIQVLRQSHELFQLIVEEYILSDQVVNTILKHLQDITSQQGISHFLETSQFQEWIRTGRTYVSGWDSVMAFVKYYTVTPEHDDGFPEDMDALLSSVRNSVDLPDPVVWAATSPIKVYFDLPDTKRVIGIGEHLYEGLPVSQEMYVRSTNIVPVLRHAIATLKP
jgi:hypothetical protein